MKRIRSNPQADRRPKTAKLSQGKLREQFLFPGTLIAEWHRRGSWQPGRDNQPVLPKYTPPLHIPNGPPGSRMKPNLSKIVVVVSYLLAAVAICTWSLTYGATRLLGGITPSAAYLPALFLFAPLLAFAIAYARLVSDSSLGKNQRIVAIIVNCCMAAGVLFYLRFVRTPGLPVNEESLTTTLIIRVIIPLFFLLVSLTIVRKYAFRYPLGTIAACIVFPYCAVIALESAIGRWDDPRSAVLLYLVFISPLIFGFAGAATYYSPPVGYKTGLAAGCMALPWLIWSEGFPFNFQMVNSWITFNLSDRDDFGNILLAGLKILAFGLIVIAIVVSALRLIPPRWTFRNSPLCTRTWPAFAVCIVALATWFGCAAPPYRIPMIVDSVWPELSVLHVEKQGLQFHETRVSVWRNRDFSIFRNDRRLFQYQFTQRLEEGYGLPPSVFQHVTALVRSSQPQVPAIWPRTLRTWNAEGWYLLTGRTRVLVYTPELGTVPPKEITDLVHEIEVQETARKSQSYVRDVCLGFCYDPLAGLGIIYINSRCRTDRNGTRCE
jgi:hypothetical protein